MVFAIHWHESAMDLHVFLIPISTPPSPSHPSGSSQCTSPEHLSHASNLGWWSVSPLIVYLFQWCSLRTSHPRLLPQSPKVCSVVPFYCGGFSQWVGLDDWLVKVSWLGKLASMFWCAELDFFSMECNGVSSSEFWDGSTCLVWLWAACMLTLRAMSLRCWRICVVCLALELIGSWVVVGFSVGMEAFGWSLIP